MVKFLDLQAITMRHGDEIKAAIDRVVESGWFLQGNENKRFEMDYAKYIGTESVSYTHLTLMVFLMK